MLGLRLGGVGYRFINRVCNYSEFWVSVPSAGLGHGWGGFRTLWGTKPGWGTASDLISCGLADMWVWFSFCSCVPLSDDISVCAGLTGLLWPQQGRLCPPCPPLAPGRLLTEAAAAGEGCPHGIPSLLQGQWLSKPSPEFSTSYKTL